MKKAILFGATGNLGREIAKELLAQNYDLTIVVRNKKKAEQFAGLKLRSVLADASQKASLEGLCEGQEVVVSAMGKSVSPNDKSKPTFNEIDFDGNSAILEQALKSKVSKFVYVSAFQSEIYQHLNYFKVHHDFSEKLKASGIDYSIVKPPAIFCAFKDVIDMARKGKVMNIGSGDKKTNPIYEGDLARVVVGSIPLSNQEIEAGGKNVYTRRQLNEIIQQEVDPSKKIRNVPIGLVKLGLPVMRLFNKNSYDKFAFFTEVMQHDTIAPQVGEMKFEDYVKMQVGKSLPVSQTVQSMSAKKKHFAS